MNLEKAVNHGEHGVISKDYADFVCNPLGKTNDLRNVLFFSVLSVISVVQSRFLG